MATTEEKLEKARKDLREARRQIKFLEIPGAENLATGATQDVSGLRSEGAAGQIQRVQNL